MSSRRSSTVMNSCATCRSATATRTDGQPIGKRSSSRSALTRMGGDRHRELRVARRLEPPRADDAVLAAGPPDLDLVDVVQQRGRLDQRAVDRDQRLGHEAGAGARPRGPRPAEWTTMPSGSPASSSRRRAVDRSGTATGRCYRWPRRRAPATDARPARHRSGPGRCAPSVTTSTSPSQVGAEDGDARPRGERREGLRRGMPVLVAARRPR